MQNIIVHSRTITQAAFTNEFTDSPAGSIFFIYGSKRIFPLSLTLAAHALIKGKSIAVVDGCCRFDVHTITNFARQRRINPDILLKRIYISRGFTSYQMEAAINNRLAQFLKKINSNTVMIFGLLDTFYGEQVPFYQVNNMLQRIVVHLKQMKEKGISILLASEERKVLPKERNQFFDLLKQNADTIYQLLEDSDDIKQIRNKNYGTHTPNIHKNNRQRD
ncbi:MAG: hypothetical protein QME58_12295 [Bacteroidota bacterium]|nr:hypothetical protein [Bacteroidota bacterium]